MRPQFHVRKPAPAQHPKIRAKSAGTMRTRFGIFHEPSAARCRSTPDPAPTTDVVEPLLKIFAKDVVFGIGHQSCPGRSQTSDQPGNPVCCLDCLIAVAFQVEMHLDLRCRRCSVMSGHTLCGSGDQVRALLVFVEDQEEVVWRLAVCGTEIIDPFDRVEKHSRVEPVGTVHGRATPSF